MCRWVHIFMVSVTYPLTSSENDWATFNQVAQYKVANGEASMGCAIYCPAVAEDTVKFWNDGQLFAVAPPWTYSPHWVKASDASP